MGQAKIRAAANARQDESLAGVDIPRLAAAMRKLATAASGSFGADCYTHAALPQAVLARLGVKAEIKIGFAGWRVGSGDSDVVLHRPVPGMIPQPGGAAYHVWLEIGTHMLDLTTYQLRKKAAQLDALDGGRTTVDWCPDYLLVPRKTVSSLKDVTNLAPGLYYYEENPTVAQIVNSGTPGLDPGEVDVLWLLYWNRDMCVVGPSSVEVV